MAMFLKATSLPNTHKNKLNSPPVKDLFESTGNLSCESKQKTWCSCNFCKNGPKHVCLVTDSLGRMSITDELSNIETPYEKSMISLTGLYSTTLKKANVKYSSWEHRVGETNILQKEKKNYHGMYGFLINRANENQASSHTKIRKALQWLKTHNHIYTHFFCTIRNVV